MRAYRLFINSTKYRTHSHTTAHKFIAAVNIRAEVTFHGGSFLVDFLKNEILGFDENLAVVL